MMANRWSGWIFFYRRISVINRFKVTHVKKNTHRKQWRTATTAPTTKWNNDCRLQKTVTACGDAYAIVSMSEKHSNMLVMPINFGSTVRL